MKSLKSLTEIVVFLEDVLGKEAADIFDENMEEVLYYVRSTALQNPTVTEAKMRGKLRKLSEGVVAESIRRFLRANYADDFGDIELNVDDGGVYDRNMNRISAIEKIRKTQREIISLMVSRGMYEFAKGRNLAKIMNAREQEGEPSPKDANWSTKNKKAKPETLELIEIQIMRLERSLPKLSHEQGQLLSSLYSRMREYREVCEKQRV